MIWNSRTLSQALGINLECDVNSMELQFNSKDVKKGDLFIALKGNTDGHEYALHAIEAGASAVIVSQDVKNIPKNKIIKVQDCSSALLSLAKYKRANSKAKFIAITGSVGKTSTKEALKLMLSSTLRNDTARLNSGSRRQDEFKSEIAQPTSVGEHKRDLKNSLVKDLLNDVVFASRGNFNNYLGLQINLASMPDDAEYAVFELGMNLQGEISDLSKFLKPDIAIITEISEAHIKFLGSLENIIDAKCEIFEGLAAGGSIIIPKYDNTVYEQIIRHAGLKKVNTIFTFGSEGTDAMLLNYEALNNSCNARYKLKIGLEDDSALFEEISLNLPIIPKSHCLNFAPCFLAIKALDLDVVNAASSLSKYVLMYGRGEIKDITAHNKNFKIICDHYNASPSSMRAALENFKSISHPRKTLILGDMLELGDQSGALHAALVPHIIKAKADKIILIGKCMKEIARYLPDSVKLFLYNNTEELLVNLLQILTNDELILIKASKSIGFEKILGYFNESKT